MEQWLSSHWIQIGMAWVLIQNFLKSIQDAVDAEPKGLQPLAKIIYYMQAVGGYLFVGNRIQSITKI